MGVREGVGTEGGTGRFERTTRDRMESYITSLQRMMDHFHDSFWDAITMARNGIDRQERSESRKGSLKLKLALGL